MVDTGVYGDTGTTYRTELDIFARITQNGDINGTSTTFTVEYKNGRTSQYGLSANSRLSPDGRSETTVLACR